MRITPDITNTLCRIYDLKHKISKLRKLSNQLQSELQEVSHEIELTKRQLTSEELVLSTLTDTKDQGY